MIKGKSPSSLWQILFNNKLLSMWASSYFTFVNNDKKLKYYMLDWINHNEKKTGRMKNGNLHGVPLQRKVKR